MGAVEGFVLSLQISRITSLFTRICIIGPDWFTSGKESWSTLNSRLGGLRSRFGRFEKKEKSFVPPGI